MIAVCGHDHLIPVQIQYPELEPGDHEFSASVSSQDEYKGEMEAYLKNNDASFKGWVNEHEITTSGGVLLIIFCLSTLSIMFLIVPIILKRNPHDPKGSG